ncbi:MAG: hypothetical protein ABSB54_03080 [Acidimicrobiales bacterium]|jgi:hypothetical protein
MTKMAGDVDNGFEQLRRAAAVNDLLNQIGLSDGRKTEWWNFSAYHELGDRTPTQAWLAGDHEAVRRLVDKWYADTEATGRRLRSNPEVIGKMRSRIEKLRGAVP